MARTRGRDLLLAALAVPAAWAAKKYASSPRSAPLAGKVWDAMGVLPVLQHFYQPVLKAKDVPVQVAGGPFVPGVDLRDAEQLALLASLLPFAAEIERLRDAPTGSADAFDFANGFFEAGDAEILYEMVRARRPKRLVEVGAGHSTRMIRHALAANRGDGQECEHVCIEPYPQPWLAVLGVDTLLRQPVERVDDAVFARLEAGDVLFIDSSHTLRTGGDVQHLYLHVLPLLAPGVLVHVHDIFIPGDYPRDWIACDRRFWTEQYVLQAFLSLNESFRVVLALAYLAEHHPLELGRACPVFAAQGSPARPGSFWIERVR